LPEALKTPAEPAMRALLRSLHPLTVGRGWEMLRIGFLVSCGTMAALIEPWIYSTIVDDIAGTFVADEPLQLPHRLLGDLGQFGVHFAQSVGRILHFPIGVGGDLSQRTIPETLATIIAGTVMMVVIRLIAEYCAVKGDNRAQRLGAIIEQRYIMRAFDHVLRLPLSFFTRRASGKIAKQVNQEEQVAPLVTAAAKDLWPDLFTLVAILVIMLFADVQLAAITALAIPLYAVISWQMSKAVDANADTLYAQWEEVASRIQETISGIKTVHAHGARAFEVNQLESRMKGGYDAFLRRDRLYNRYYVMQQLVVVVVKGTVLALGGYKALQHELTPGAVVMFLSYLETMFSPVENLAGLWTSLQAHVGSLKRSEKLLAEPAALREDMPPLRATRGEVVFEGVHFGYAERDVLRGVSFRIAAGEHVAIVGPSGAGKTTLTDLLSGLYQPRCGRILIDGTPLDAVAPSSVQGVVRGVAVDGVLFRGSMADNIRYGRFDASDVDVQDAARLAGLGPLLERLPSGLATLVGERGVQLSAGERQRILLARAFMARPAVLLLDEATANLDFRTEAEVQRAISEVARGRTTIIVAHRRSMMAGVQRVLVLRNGVIEQDGTPEALMETPGYFREMMGPANK
jgi:ABC-type bacteriocin/lantibiotic exporter with double-glycine peptidase domain